MLDKTTIKTMFRDYLTQNYATIISILLSEISSKNTLNLVYFGGHSKTSFSIEEIRSAFDCFLSIRSEPTNTILLLSKNKDKYDFVLRWYIYFDINIHKYRTIQKNTYNPQNISTKFPLIKI